MLKQYEKELKVEWKILDSTVQSNLSLLNGHPGDKKVAVAKRERSAVG